MALNTAVYAGSFDPVTNGHLDILNRSLKVFDSVHVGIIENIDKKPMFSIDERVDMFKHSIKSDQVSIEGFKGLLVDFIKSKNTYTIIRGLRAVSDFDYEFQMALLNRQLESKVDTVYFMTDQKYSYLSASIVRQLGQLNAKISDFVSPYVEKKLKEKCYE